MSTVNVQPTANARSAVAYALYGTSGDRYQRFEDEDKDTRTKWYTCSMGEPKEIVARAEQVGAAFHRRNEMYTGLRLVLLTLREAGACACGE